MDTKEAEYIIKLSQNENPLGPSPLALQAIHEYSLSMNRYPEPHSQTLKYDLAKHIGLLPEKVFVCAGSIEALDIIIRNFIEKGENLILAEITFVAYKLLANVFGVDTRFSKMKDYRIDIHSILDLYDEKTKLIIIANPNNPTGTIITHDELVKLMESVSPNTYVIMDEAYCEYVSSPDFPKTIDLQNEYPNLIILRTFSKIYGLAGLRVGYAIAHSDLIERLEYLQAPFTVNLMATAAVMATLKDTHFVEENYKTNLESRNFLERELVQLGYNVIPSQSNFIYIHFDTSEERDLHFDRLANKKVLIRKMCPFGDAKAFRMTIPKPDDCQKVIDILRGD